MYRVIGYSFDESGNEEKHYLDSTSGPFTCYQDAEKLVNKIKNDPSYFQFEIVKKSDKMIITCKRFDGKYNKQEVKTTLKMKRKKIEFFVYGYTATVPEIINSKKNVNSLIEALELIKGLVDNKKYYEFRILKRSKDGDEFLSDYTIPGVYSFSEVREFYFEECQKEIDKKKVLQEKVVKQNSSHETFSNIIIFEEKKKQIQESHVNLLENLNKKLGKKLKLDKKQKKGNKAKFGSTKGKEKKRQKAKQKYKTKKYKITVGRY